MKAHRSKQVVALLCLVLMVNSCSSSGNKLSPTAAPYSSLPSTVNKATKGGGATQLAFVSDRGQHGNLDIWLFNLTTGQMESLTSDDWQDVRPIWSPSGHMLTFMSFAVGGTIGLRTFSISDRVTHTLVRPGSRVSVTSFAWSRDEKSIFYTAFNSEAFESQIWKVDLQAGEPQYITNGESPIAVSIDGQYLAFSIRGTEPRSRAVVRILRLSDGTEIEPAAEYSSPVKLVWSPLDNVLAASPLRGSPLISTYLVNGKEMALQAEDSTIDTPRTFLCNLIWSPNGSEILAVHSLFTSNLCQGELLLYNRDLTHYQLLSLEGPISDPAWSADGRWIAYSRDDTLNISQQASGLLEQRRGEIWVVESTGLNARPLITGPSYNGQPAWKP